MYEQKVKNIKQKTLLHKRDFLHKNSWQNNTSKIVNAVINHIPEIQVEQAVDPSTAAKLLAGQASHLSAPEMAEMYPAAQGRHAGLATPPTTREPIPKYVPGTHNVQTPVAPVAVVEIATAPGHKNHN